MLSKFGAFSWLVSPKSFYLITSRKDQADGSYFIDYSNGTQLFFNRPLASSDTLQYNQTSMKSYMRNTSLTTGS